MILSVKVTFGLVTSLTSGTHPTVPAHVHADYNPLYSKPSKLASARTHKKNLFVRNILGVCSDGALSGSVQEKNQLRNGPTAGRNWTDERGGR